MSFALKLWQFDPQFVTILPSKCLFMSILCCQKASKLYKICNINFWYWKGPPPIETFPKIHQFWWWDGFPNSWRNKVFDLSSIDQTEACSITGLIKGSLVDSISSWSTKSTSNLWSSLYHWIDHKIRWAFDQISTRTVDMLIIGWSSKHITK